MYSAGALPVAVKLWIQVLLVTKGVAGVAALAPGPILGGLRGWLAKDIFYVSPVVMVAAVTYNYRRLTEEDQRRRVKWVVYGSILSLTPQILLSAGEILFGGDKVSWGDLPADACSVGIPLSVAYGVVKHRIFDIRVVVRRTLQYLFARRALQTILALPVIALAIVIVRNRNMTIGELVLSHTAYLLWIAAARASLTFRDRVRLWLDRRFFRERFDREHLLLGVLDDLASVDTMSDISQMVKAQLEQALHPSSIRLWYRDPVESKGATSSDPTVEIAMEPPKELLAQLEDSHNPVQFSKDRLSPDIVQWMTAAGVQLLVPISDGNAHVVGALVLGARKSEKRYSPGDRTLLLAVAKQIGAVRETLRLRAQVGEDRRIQHDVLARLDSRLINILKECPACGACFDGGAVQCDKDGHTLALSLPVERLIDRRYRLDCLIGKGGMGAVYEAIDERLRRTVAVKVMIGRQFGDPHAVRRFHREARAAAQLNHPNIVVSMMSAASKAKAHTLSWNASRARRYAPNSYVAAVWHLGMPQSGSNRFLTISPPSTHAVSSAET